MKQEHMEAGTEVPPGLYRCNACANEHQVTEEEKKLPCCSACDSISWRAFRIGNDVGTGRGRKDG